jgi:hypothetical protein
MQVGQLTADVKLVSTGFSRSRGSPISENEIAPETWKTWVAEGIIVLPKLDSLDRHARMKLKRRKRAIPQ